MTYEIIVSTESSDDLIYLEKTMIPAGQAFHSWYFDVVEPAIRLLYPDYIHISVRVIK